VNIICGVLLIILIVILIVCLCRPKDNKNKKDSFGNVNNKNDKVAYVLHRDGCPFSNNFVEMLKKLGMKIKDLKFEILDINGNGKGLAHRFGATGTPTTVCPLHNTKAVGLIQDPNELYNKLMKNENKEGTEENDNNESNESNEKDIVIVHSPHCRFCHSMMEVLNKKLGKGNYGMIDSKTEEGQKLLEKFEMNGVPLTINQQTNAHIKGFSEDISEIM
jgi:thioredoxin-related protein